MPRLRHRFPWIRHSIVLLVIPFALVSVGYAFFSQTLSIDTTTNVPAYSASNNLRLTYSITYGTSGGRTVYNITATVTNIGTENITSWQAGFDIPTDYSNQGCGTTVICTFNPTYVSASSTGTSNTIAPGASRQFTVTFRSSDPSFMLNNLYVAGVVQVTYGPIAGLSISSSLGAASKQGSNWSRNVTFTVTNNSGATVTDWQAYIEPWAATDYSITNVPATVNYVSNPPQLVFVSTQSIANNSTFQFTVRITRKGSAWTPTSQTIEGAQ